MPQRVNKPGTAAQFVYRRMMDGCEFEDRYPDTVEDHERSAHGHMRTQKPAASSPPDGDFR